LWARQIWRGIWRGTHWLKDSERSIADFIPLLPLGSGSEVGIIDYVIKIVVGAVTLVCSYSSEKKKKI
jgi:hypothetical protein